MNRCTLALLFICLLTFSNLIFAQTDLPDSHAPIGVMGDHTHESGEWMFSYRYMLMDMKDNLVGSSSISPDQIVTTIPNRFSNPPMMPPTLRVAPTEMSTSMHMLGLMYAPNDQITLIAMLNVLQKEMTHLTYQGAAGTTVLGGFETESSGLGDSKVGVIYGIKNSEESTFLLNLGLSIPTGDIEATDQILTPMNMRPTVRIPYPMQLGSGTWDIEPGITYKGNKGALGWGSQAKFLYHIGENDEGYTLGDKFNWANWVDYRFNNNVSGSLRLTFVDESAIDGIDPAIALPVQTADPDNSGYERWDLAVGINTIFPGNHRISAEYEFTVDQNVEGVQMEMESMFTIGYQFAF